MKKGSRNTIVEQEGIHCPRCDSITERRYHKAITPKEEGRPFYYSQWYNCKNKDCKTTLIMLEEDKVYNNNSRARMMIERESQVSFFKSL